MNIRNGQTLHVVDCDCLVFADGGTLTQHYYEELPEALRALATLQQGAIEARKNDGPRELLYYSVHVRGSVNGWSHVLHARKNDGRFPWEVRYKV